MNTVLKVLGMTCSHCESSVTKALEELNGVNSVDVDLSTGQVRVAHSADVSRESMIEAIEDVGFDVEK